MIELVKNRMCLPRVLLSLMLATCFMPASGCSKSVTRSRVVSTCEAEHESGTETLELRADGTYSHRFKATQGPESTYSDKWEFSANDPGPTVLLHNFSPHFPNNSWVKGGLGFRCESRLRSDSALRELRPASVLLGAGSQVISA